MKRKYLYFLLIGLVLCAGFFYLIRLFFIAENQRVALGVNAKKNLTVLITQFGYCNVDNNLTGYFSVSAMLINHSKDTIRLVGTNCLYSKLVYNDNKNMLQIDDRRRRGNTRLWEIAPQRAVSLELLFKFRKVPDTTFKFKIGLDLINWQKGKDFNLGRKLKGKPDILWSDEEIFWTNKKHQEIELPWPEEEKRRIEMELKKPWPIYHPLTQTDIRNYILSIDQSQIKRSKPPFSLNDSINKLEHASLVLKLTNKSSDTLKYLMMTCSWNEFYIVDNKNISIGPWACESNFLTVKKIAPHSVLILVVPVVFDKKLGDHQKFKIGMSLQKFINNSQFDDDPEPWIYMLRPETRNLIWSNEVTTP